VASVPPSAATHATRAVPAVSPTSAATLRFDEAQLSGLMGSSQEGTTAANVILRWRLSGAELAPGSTAGGPMSVVPGDVTPASDLRISPAESRAHTEPLLRAVHRAGVPRAKSAKEARTVRPRRTQYFLSAHVMTWADDSLLGTSDQRRGALQLAMCAAHIGTGNSLWMRTVKVGTIRNYVNDVNGFLIRFAPRGADFRKDAPGDKSLSPTLTRVYADEACTRTLPFTFLRCGGN